MAAASHANILIKRLARVLECTRMLDLNRSDAEFRGLFGGPPGDIIYVIDTNFVQAFLQPKAWHRCSRLFHDFDIWNPTEREEEWGYPDALAMGEAVAGEATLLATEFVLTMASKSAYQHAFISPEHQIELEGQLGELERYWSKNRAKIAGLTIEHHKQVNAAAMRPRDRPGAVELFELEGKLFTGDLNFDKMSDRHLDRVVDNHIVARICRVLAQDEIIEPFEQIERLATDDPSQSVYPLEWAFHLDPGSDEFKREQALWRELLQKEDQRRTRQRKEAAKRLGSERKASSKLIERGSASLDADASTLAHLICLTRGQLKPRERIVFITGDRLMLNAYRRWYATHGEAVSYLLRPIAVYAPHYNLKDAGANLARELEAFDSARRALEASTYTMTSTLKDYYFGASETARFASARARDKFCADAEDDCVSEELLQQLIPFAFSRGRMEAKVEELDAMVTNVRWLERIAMAAVPHLVRKRVDQSTQRAADFLDRIKERESEDRDGEVERWLADRMSKAVDAAFRFSLPSAVTWISKFARSPGRKPLRVPITLSLRVPYGREALTMDEWAFKLADEANAKETEAALQDLSKYPSQLFALAAWLAYRRHAWGDAVRFADFASRSAQGAPESEQDKELVYECLYLKAVSLRMRMMAEAPQAEHFNNRSGERDVDVWRRDLDGIETALETCMAMQRQSRARVLRAHAERASARLGYCEWAAVGDLGALGAYRLERLDLRDIFRNAVDDLDYCQAQLLGLKNSSKENHESDAPEILNWVERQTALAPECARIVYEILIEKPDPHRGEAYLPLMPNVRRRLLNLRDQPDDASLPPVLRAYALSAALRKTNSDEVRSRLMDLDEETSLDLDRAMIRTIKYRARTRGVGEGAEAETREPKYE